MHIPVINIYELPTEQLRPCARKGTRSHPMGCPGTECREHHSGVCSLSCAECLYAARERREAAELQRQQDAAESAHRKRVAAEQEQLAMAAQLEPGEVIMVARFTSDCSRCAARLIEGRRIIYSRLTRKARHFNGCRAEQRTFRCRWCGESVVNGASSFGGVLCPMSDGGEQPHRA